MAVGAGCVWLQTTIHVHKDAKRAFQVWEADCSWTLMPQGGHNDFDSSGSVTSEKVTGHTSLQGHLCLYQPRGVVERA